MCLVSNVLLLLLSPLTKKWNPVQSSFSASAGVICHVHIFILSLSWTTHTHTKKSNVQIVPPPLLLYYIIWHVTHIVRCLFWGWTTPAASTSSQAGLTWNIKLKSLNKKERHCTLGDSSTAAAPAPSTNCATSPGGGGGDRPNSTLHPHQKIKTGTHRDSPGCPGTHRV